MHIGFLLYNWDGPGGIESQARQLARKLAARGERVTVVTTVPPRALGRRGLLVPNVEVFRVPLTRSPFFEEIARALFASRGGVEVLNAVQFTCGVHAARIARKTGVPVVLKFAGGGAYGDLATLPKLEDGVSLKEELDRVDRYVMVSDEIAREGRAYGLDPRRFATIRNGVDLARFDAEVAPARLFEGDGRLVLYVGRLSEEKRPALLVRAFARVVKEVPEARLALAGPGPEEGELRALVSELGLDASVRLLGPRPDVPALQRAASVYVLPSASEGSPNALLEALAAGTPAVATEIPAVSEIVRPEREALLVPRDDEAALARAIVRLLRDRELAARLAAAGRERVRQEFDLERTADRYLELFHNVIAQRTAPLDWRLGARGRSVLALRALASRLVKRREEPGA
jgi:glycosyltransferase involved in cell wall biosynthesis